MTTKIFQTKNRTFGFGFGLGAVCTVGSTVSVVSSSLPLMKEFSGTTELNCFSFDLPRLVLNRKEYVLQLKNYINF